MNDSPTPPLTDDDLSAALDGEATDAVVEAIAASPEAQARQAALAAAAARVRASSVAPLPADTVDDLVARAIDPPEAPARAAGARPGGVPRWLAAAAVLVLMVAGLALVFTGREGGDEEFATTAAEIDDLAADGVEEAAEAGASGADDLDGGGFASTTDAGGTDGAAASPESTFGTLAPSDLPPVGTFDDGDALREALADALPTGGRAAIDEQEPPSTEAVERCAQQIQVVLDLADPPARRAWAVVDGAATVVFEFADTGLADDGSTSDADASTLVAGLDVASCQPVTLFVR